MLTKYLWGATLLVLAGFLLCGCSGVTGIKMFGIDLVTPLGSLKMGMDSYEANRPFAAEEIIWSPVPLVLPQPEPEPDGAE